MAPYALKDEIPLDEQEVLFCDEYLRDNSSSVQAAIRAGYSPEEAKDVGPRLLKDGRVKRRFLKAEEIAVKRLGITVGKVLEELSKIAFANPGDVITKDEDGNLSIIPGSSGSEINITETTGRNKAKIVTVKTIKTSDKLMALEKLGKHIGMFKDKVEVEHKGSLIDLIEQSYKLEDTPSV